MITSLYTALLALILIFLSIKIIQNRRSAKISLGENGDDFLHRKIRAHGNFIEYTPIFLIQREILERVFLIYFLKKIVAVIPSPRLLRRGLGCLQTYILEKHL